MISKKKILQNFIWKLAERCGKQLTSFVVTIILARILLPSDYGMVALIMIFLSILQVFADSGLGVALIQKQYVDEIDYSTVFYTNLFLSFLLYAIAWFSAPKIASFFYNNELILMIRFLACSVIINSINNVQQAYISRHMIFKKNFFASIGGIICASIIGIYSAYNGAGAWALIFQQITDVFIGTIILWVIVPWRPRLLYSFYKIKKLFSFGWKMLASTLISTGYDQLWQLMIGKLYSPMDLAFFNQGQKFPNFIVTNINSSIDSVLFPVMSNAQGQISTVREMMKKSIKISIFIMAPTMMILAFCSKNIVCLLLTDKWIPCVPFLYIFCIYYMFWPVQTANLNAIKALGRSDIYLKLEIIKKSLGLLVLFFTIKYDVITMAYGLLVVGFFSQIINSWPNKKILNYGYVQQLKDLLPSVLLALASGIISYWVGIIQINLLLLVFIQIFAGFIFYFGIAWMLKIDSMIYLIRNMRIR